MGYYRHFIDPTKPFSQPAASQVQGFVVTMTLTDPVADTETAWRVAEERTGAGIKAGFCARVESPTTTPSSRGLVGDVPKNQPGALAAAFESLFGIGWRRNGLPPPFAAARGL